MPRRTLRSAAAALGAAGLTVGFASAASAHPVRPGEGNRAAPAGGYTASVLLSGSQLTHEVNGAPEALAKPDDIVVLGRHLFVAFQNGVGSTGGASPTGNAASTVVETTTNGRVVSKWDVTGKIDGMGADPATGTLAATVDEDGSSSLYTIDPEAPAGAQVTHYSYDRSPLPHGGGTDAVSFYRGMMLVSASAPTVADGPAVYRVTLVPPAAPGGTGTAVTQTLFADNAPATPADPGAPARLALTDPDSNTIVPWSAPRFGGDFMLDSQGDGQQIYVGNAGTPAQTLSVLSLGQPVNDTAFATSRSGALYVTDTANDSLDRVTGPFRPGQALVAATPCGANAAPSTCPAPGFSANYLGGLDLATGQVTQLPVTGGLQPQGMVFVPGHGDQGSQGHRPDGGAGGEQDAQG